jgi:ABC-type antimicrobial peptide transport system permease subunit
MDVIQPVLRKTARIVIAGVALGVSVALLATSAVSRFLYGLSATDPMVVTSVASLVVGIALAAAVMPARRAARVDPAVALRSE